jgi:hypothetical protein
LNILLKVKHPIENTGFSCILQPSLTASCF